MHARKRWVTALTQRINHYMEASAHAVEVFFFFLSHSHLIIIIFVKFDSNNNFFIQLYLIL